MKRLTLFLAFGALALTQAEAGPETATKDKPWENSLGMKFVPTKKTNVLFCVWLTRVQDFKEFVNATKHDATKGMFSLRPDGIKQCGETWNLPGFTQGPTHPVVGVSWEDAKAFCAWLSEKERTEGRLTGDQMYRLPTDAEWSEAAGLNEDSSRIPVEKNVKILGIYPWGKQWPPPPKSGNFAGEESREGAPAKWTVIAGYNDGFPRTSPVGSFAANEFGLFDMGGNVWQWCEDMYYPPQPGRVVRGASWGYGALESLLLSSRYDIEPERRDVRIGFRCVLFVCPAE